jgi:adenylate cyclase
MLCKNMWAIKSTHHQRSALIILMASMLLGIVYPLMADSTEDWVAQLNGFIIGTAGGLLIIFYELHLFFFPKKMHRFTAILATKVTLYTLSFILIIILTISATRSVEAGMPYYTYIQSDAFKHFLLDEDFLVIAAYTLTCVAIVVTTRQVSRKMGSGELFNYIIGKYHQPQKEHRIFLAIDLRNSTGIAEQLGELKYHEFLKHYIYDLTYCIAIHNGTIYRYVGDQVTISWLLPAGLKNNNAVQCFFTAINFIAANQYIYADKFGVVPQFIGSLDMGEVLTAEIGLDKKQLAFYGGVIERLYKIEHACKQTQQNLLISEYLAAPIRQTRQFEFTYCTSLTGLPENKVDLFSVKPVR